MQSRSLSARESIAQVAIGYVLNQVVLAIFFPGSSLAKNLALGVVMTLVSFARQYAVRRYYNLKGIHEKTIPASRREADREATAS